MGFFFCVHVYIIPVQQLPKDIWADRRALCLLLVAAKELHNIIRICMLFNGFRVVLMCFEWKKNVIHSQGTKISSKMPLLEHHNAIGREMSNLCTVSWPTSLCLHHLYTHRSSTSGSLRVLSFKKKSVSAKQNHSIWGGRQSLPKPTDCNSFNL